jgi:hypothetical protein
VYLHQNERDFWKSATPRKVIAIAKKNSEIKNGPAKKEEPFSLSAYFLGGAQ